jgi:hypothetical protein
VPRPKTPKKRINLIEKLLAQLAEEGRADWADFTECDRTLLDLQRWWQERGITVGLQACETWRRNHYQAGRRAKEIKALIGECRGLKGMELLEYSACEAAYAVTETHKLLEDAGEALPKLLFLHIAAVKELRACAAELNDAQVRGDRMVDMLSASYEVVRKALTSAKDHPNEGWLEEVLHGAVTAMEDELRRERLGDN